MTESAPAAAAPLSESDDKLWASLSHFGGILSFLAPLLIWLILKDRGPKVNVEAKESLNFQITVAIAHAANFIIGLILTAITFGLWGIVQTLIWLAIVAVTVIFCVMGGIKVNGGGSYRYPVTFRFIK
ncbi:DUF4870 domain-containing protein [uncultured Schumannella sp.]|uniref:DUF4870 domain-containing protein n=1 Tax=uncultured Schumannella sp. TaxID=1195956 RepID=UPI0025F5ED04|nr:DUF4870 domain-containing protein [uncultured Schumannella sp.]